MRVAVGPELSRVVRQRNHARDSKPGEGEQQRDRPVLLVIQQREIGRINPLREHLARELLGQPVINPRELGAMDRRAARQAGKAILGLLLKQRTQRNDAMVARCWLPA